MIDYFKTKPIRIPNSQRFDWSTSVNKNTGELGKTEVAIVNGIKLVQKDGKTVLSGSLHKFNNGGLHNYNDFVVSSLKRVIDHLSELFDIDPFEILLSKLEFGVNIHVVHPVANYINAIVGHKSRAFKCYSPDRFPGSEGIFCEHYNHVIKVYSKTAQHALQNNVLRYEVKAKEMAFFKNKKIGIRSLADLKNPRIIKKLRDTQLEAFEDVVMVDPYHEKNLNTEETLLMAKFTNPHEWPSIIPKAQKFPLKNKDPGYHRERIKYYRERKRMNEIIEKYELSTLKNELIEAIHQKYMEDRLDVPVTNSGVTIC